jgi:hypothetical protein
MLVIARRLLVFAAFSFWIGGFTFYAAVVVPAGSEVLGSHRTQGFVTQQVTTYLNISGALALLPLAWDAAASRDPYVARRWARWLAWLGMGLTLVALVWLHSHLDAFLDPHEFSVLDSSRFRPAHRVYLWTSTVQFGCGLTYLVLTVCAWRSEDRSVTAP